MPAEPSASDREHPRIRRVLSSRRGGVSSAPYDSFNLGSRVGDSRDSVASNRNRLAAQLQVQPADLVFMEQVHGKSVAVIDRRYEADVPMADAMVTTTAGLVLVALAADCAPVILWDEQAFVAAVMHSGRPGTRLNIAAETVRTMVSLGARADCINALIGPAICGDCYEVPVTMRADVERHAPGSGCTTSAGTPGLDIRAGIVGQLRAAGLTAIAVDSRCTAQEPDLFSHRRDNGRTGRQGVMVWIEQ